MSCLLRSCSQLPHAGCPALSVGLLHRLAGLEGTYAVALTAPGTYLQQFWDASSEGRDNRGRTKRGLLHSELPHRPETAEACLWSRRALVSRPRAEADTQRLLLAAPTARAVCTTQIRAVAEETQGDFRAYEKQGADQKVNPAGYGFVVSD